MTLLPEFGGEVRRTNVVEVPDDDDLMFFIDNWDRDNPEKIVQVQVTFHSSGGAPSGFNVWMGPDPFPGGETFIPAEPHLVDMDPRDPLDEWFTGVYEFYLFPNPPMEVIGLKFDRYPAYVDQVVIDTWCVPEPATMILLAVGAAVVMRPQRGR